MKPPPTSAAKASSRTRLRYNLAHLNIVTAAKTYEVTTASCSTYGGKGEGGPRVINTHTHTHKQVSVSLAHTKAIWLALQGQSLVSGTTFKEVLNIPSHS